MISKAGIKQGRKGSTNGEKVGSIKFLKGII